MTCVFCKIELQMNDLYSVLYGQFMCMQCFVSGQLHLVCKECKRGVKIEKEPLKPQCKDCDSIGKGLLCESCAKKGVRVVKASPNKQAKDECGNCRTIKKHMSDFVSKIEPPIVYGVSPIRTY